MKEFVFAVLFLGLVAIAYYILVYAPTTASLGL
jgi:hypothetical protein